MTGKKTVKRKKTKQGRGAQEVRAKETGGCKKARKSLEAQIGSAEDVIMKPLRKAHSALMAILGQEEKTTGADKPVVALERIGFDKGGLALYIRFLLVSEDEDIKGAIVYGVAREPRYPYTLWSNSQGKEQWEEKPLAFLSVDALGKISMKGKSNDQWWLSSSHDVDEDDEEVAAEIHYRTLDLIWRDALNWVNEPLLP